MLHLFDMMSHVSLPLIFVNTQYRCNGATNIGEVQHAKMISEVYALSVFVQNLLSTLNGSIC